MVEANFDVELDDELERELAEARAELARGAAPATVKKSKSTPKAKPPVQAKAETTNDEEELEAAEPGGSDDEEPETAESPAKERLVIDDSVIPFERQVIIHRFGDSVSRVPPGRQLIVMDMSETVKNLAQSGFMLPWLSRKIQEHLEQGGVFENIDDNTGQPRSTYKIATEEELLDLAQRGLLFHAQNGASHEDRNGRRRARRGYYRLLKNTMDEYDWDLIYDDLPRQAKVMIDLLVASGRTEFTADAIEQVLKAGGDKLKSKDPMKSFGTNFNAVFKTNGMMVKLDDEGAVEQESDNE